MKSISITKTKGIAQMKFDFPENPGVYLLVGPNGAGKTTLLVAIDRICNPLAFAHGFVSSRYGSGYDEYNNAEISYHIGDSCIHFRKKVARWAASPRKGNADLLALFGFASSICIKADSRRIEASPEEIQSGQRQPADPCVIATLNQIFETEKFSKLKKLRVSRGRGRAPAFLNIIQDGHLFYSEKRFSTGEIAIIRLVEQIQAAANNSLVLLDEAEMALHPRVQTNLLAYLSRKSSEKCLTVFVATHSPTIIKGSPPDHIFLLNPKHNGTIDVLTPCYPTMALGSVDYESSKYFDYVFFVEDEMARLFLQCIVKRFKEIASKHVSADVAIVPVGGYLETAQMAVRTSNQLLRTSKVYAFVDADAFDELDKKPEFSALLRQHGEKIHNLSVTPEVAFIEILTGNKAIIEPFRCRMHCEISAIVRSTEYLSCNSPKQRKLAKDRFSVFVKKCIGNTGDHEEIIKRDLIALVTSTYDNGKIQHILGPIFNSR